MCKATCWVPLNGGMARLVCHEKLPHLWHWDNAFSTEWRKAMPTRRLIEIKTGTGTTTVLNCEEDEK